MLALQAVLLSDRIYFYTKFLIMPKNRVIGRIHFVLIGAVNYSELPAKTFHTLGITTHKTVLLIKHKPVHIQL